MGVPIVFFRGAKNFHGAHANGISFYNADANFSHEWVYWHEFGHWLKNNQPELFGKLSDAANVTDEQIAEKKKSRTELSDEELREEIICDAMGDVARRAGIFQQFVKKNQSLIQRLMSWAKSTLDKFTDWFHTHEVELATGEKLPKTKNAATEGVNTNADNKRITQKAREFLKAVGLENRRPKSEENNGANGHSDNFMPIDLELEQGEDGYYRIVTAYPKSAKSVEGILLFEDSTHSSSVAATDSLMRLTDDISGVSNHRANAKSSIPSAENIPQSERTDKPKYSLEAGDNSNESFVQRIRNKISALFDDTSPSKQRDKKITELLSKISGYRIAFGHFANGDISVDDFQKIIRSRHAYEWEKLLPVVGKKIAGNSNALTPCSTRRGGQRIANSISARIAYLKLGMGNISSALINFTQLINASGYDKNRGSFTNLSSEHRACRLRKIRRRKKIEDASPRLREKN